MSLVPLLFGLLVQAPNLHDDLEALMARPEMRRASVGMVVETEDGKRLYEHNGDQRLLPASNEKLFTCAFALWKLGPNYRTHTDFWKEPAAIVVHATGDPMLKPEDLTQIAAELNPGKALGVRVCSAYRPGVMDEWELGDLPNRYAARVSAFTLDRGGLELWNENGEPKLRPAVADIAIMQVPGAGKPTWTFDTFHKEIEIVGTLPKKTERLDTLALPDPEAEAASYLGSSYRPIDSYPTRPPDKVFLSTPIAELLKTCLQLSDNNLAENFLMLAASEGRAGLTGYDDARPLIRAFLKDQVKLDPAAAAPSDGSGLSRHNIVSASAICALLEWSLRQPTRDLWLASLDHPGSGTLTSRLGSVPLRGKTGTMDMVSALSGYLTLPDGRLAVVSIVLNDFSCPSSQAKAFENLLMTKAYDDLAAKPTN